MEILLVIAILWLVGNLVYAVAPAVREGYRWARINLQLMHCILVVCGGLIVSVYIWGKAQRHPRCTRVHGGGHPSRRHPVTHVQDRGDMMIVTNPRGTGLVSETKIWLDRPTAQTD